MPVIKKNLWLSVIASGNLFSEQNKNCGEIR